VINTFINETEVFEINENLSVTVDKIGSQDKKVVIIDNFYKHPEQVRNLALTIPPTTNTRIRTHLPGPRINAFYTLDHLGPVFDDIIKNVYPEWHMQFPRSHINNVFRDSTFVVNIMHNKFLEPRTPHIDCPDPRAFAAMIYLNTPNECEGGTGFYTFDGHDSGTATTLYNNKDSEKLTQYIAGDAGDWKMYHHVDMKWNRMVLYQANIYHAAHITNDMYTDSTYRINQMFFI